MENNNSFIERWIEKQGKEDRSVELSVIVPAYNEERRLPPTLIEMIDFFDNEQRSYEIIVVDDGSSDQTSEMVRRFERIRPQVRLIRVPKNTGKGNAVRVGVLNSYGKFIIFADADGATPIEEIRRLEDAINAGTDIAIGSRAKASTDTSVTTRWYRKYLGRMFNWCVNRIVLPGIEDTQCGFKMFNAPAAHYLFEHQKADGFSFDVEILFIAQRANIKIKEVAVNWTNIPGSKVNLVLDALKMFRDILFFRLRHRQVSPENYQSFLAYKKQNGAESAEQPAAN